MRGPITSSPILKSCWQFCKNNRSRRADATRNIQHIETLVPAGPAARRLVATRNIEHIETLVPAGPAARRLVATRDIQHIETLVPGGPAASPACRDPRHPTYRNISTRRAGGSPACRDPQHPTHRNISTWRAGGLAGLSRPATSNTSKGAYASSPKYALASPRRDGPPYPFNLKKLFNTAPRSVSAAE
jgi:hypothetical protein